MNDALIVVWHPRLSDGQRTQILLAADDHRVVFADDADEAARLVSNASAVAGSVPDDALAEAERLVWIHSWAAGPVVTETMRAPTVTMTSSKSNGAVPLAEHAMMLMLMLNRDAVRWLDAQRARRWERFTHGELAGLTCGIIGLGYSGTDLAAKASAFHMRVLGLRRNAHLGAVDGVDQMYGRDELHAFLSASDFVVVTAPLTSETEGLLGEPEFRAMKHTGFYVCISRGGVADPSALERALREGWIAGAGLDAHAEEPLGEDSSFWDLPNTVVTPHNGATSPQTIQRGVDIFADNLRRFVRGQPLTNLVDTSAGY